jgi:hypothetical protein
VTAQDVGHTIRVTEIAFNVTGASRPATSPPTAVVQAMLSRLSVSPGAFRAARSGGSVMSSRKIGTGMRYVLSVSASIRFTIEEVVPGRRSGHRCDPPSTRNHNGARRLRYVAVAGAFTVAGHPGKNSFRFSGRLRGKPLAPGTYRLTATSSTNGRRATAQTAPLRILQ